MKDKTYEVACPECGHSFVLNGSIQDSMMQQMREHILAEEVARIEQRYRNEKALELKAQEALAVKEKATIENEVVMLRQQLAEQSAQNMKDINNAVELALAKQNQAMMSLRNEIEMAKVNQELSEKNLRANYDVRLQAAKEEVAFYKEFKAKQSTKMVGESLEQYCEVEFNKVRAMSFPNAYFEKDNQVIAGSKGDFIFKDYVDGVESLSIMFEMKNECDATATKKTNESFLKELDKDRKAKGCEYAVLVSMLEADNELYNQGIVDMSYKYPKLYVIRPQFFLPLIALLRDMSKSTIGYKLELAQHRATHLDITNFETEFSEFKNNFGRNYRLASDKFAKAIKEIDSSIASLQKTKEALLSSEKNLRIANDKVDNMSVKKLLKNSPSLR